MAADEDRLGDAVHAGFGIVWDWSEARRGAVCALPGGVVLLGVDTSLGMCFALGTVLAATLGVPRNRRWRVRLVLVGAAFAVAYALSSVFGLSAVLAVVALTVFAYAGVLFSVRKPAAKLFPAMLLRRSRLGRTIRRREGSRSLPFSSLAVRGRRP